MERKTFLDSVVQAKSAAYVTCLDRAACDLAFSRAELSEHVGLRFKTPTF